MSLTEMLQNKEIRDEFVSANVDANLAFQIRALRKQRGWSQQELGKRIGRQPGQEQPGVSRLETPGHRYSLASLKKLASAFDVALMVRFVPFRELTDWLAQLGPQSHLVPSFADETATPQEINIPLSVTVAPTITPSADATIAVEDTTPNVDLSAFDYDFTALYGAAQKVDVPANDNLALAA